MCLQVSWVLWGSLAIYSCVHAYPAFLITGHQGANLLLGSWLLRIFLGFLVFLQGNYFFKKGAWRHLAVVDVCAMIVDTISSTVSALLSYGVIQERIFFHIDPVSPTLQLSAYQESETGRVAYADDRRKLKLLMWISCSAFGSENSCVAQ